jgi:Protein of unknown function (DUF3405)
MWYLQSIIVEAALAIRGEYAMYLLVDVKNKSQGIREDPVACATMLERCVPTEFQSIAVLFDETSLESWYPEVGDHRCVLESENESSGCLLAIDLNTR